ncbi:hypothetical protein [Roseomonas marmotae]|uniref:Uncharacterized protein n=1 Tax=Roseomonas marmotae TaxID=2768161 RepID=A0ABS3K697_9PROT|nr:hypothetical protein [Roseomonas marmotae]MBO1072985.1 hypothetical protein [Roseomonas marmotae]QTI79366.1 hypothetical protein IAI58_00555 [Roseomonas marmotae]
MRQHLPPFRTALALLAMAMAGTTAASAQGIGQMGLLNQGEHLNVPEARTQPGNIVGGGHVTVLQAGTEHTVLLHSSPGYAFAAAGIPVDTGGSNGDLLYLIPAGQSGAVLAATPAIR